MKKYDKFGDYKIKKGEKVYLLTINKKKLLGIGTYCGKDKISYEGQFLCLTPCFKLKNKIIRGFECWWIPIKEALKTSQFPKKSVENGIEKVKNIKKEHINFDTIRLTKQQEKELEKFLKICEKIHKKEKTGTRKQKHDNTIQ